MSKGRFTLRWLFGAVTLAVIALLGGLICDFIARPRISERAE